MRYSFDVVVMDFDGTLSRSAPGITRSAAAALEALGRPVPPQEVLDRFIGPPLLYSFTEFCGLSEAEAREAVRLYRERYSAVGLFETEIYPGIAQLLRELKEAGIYVAVASGKPEPFLRRVMDRFGITLYVDAVAGPSMESFSADKTEQIRAVLPEGVAPARVCMVGDRCFDIDAAVRLGVVGIGVTYGYGTREELTASGADLIAEDVAQLRSLILGSGPVRRGCFITLEGTDGCGKSTQLRLLDEYLRARGWETVITREPGGCPISERLREIVLSLESEGMSAECEALIYAAARVEHVKRVILPALEAGRVVLSDRFYDSSYAYQACGRQLGAEFIRQINGPALALVRPDCTLQFDIDRAAARERLAKGAPLDRLECEREEFFLRVADGYRQCAEADPGRIRRIDSGRSIEAVFESVLQAIPEL